MTEHISAPKDLGKLGAWQKKYLPEFEEEKK